IPTEAANNMMFSLRESLSDLAGQSVEGLTIAAADDFSYHDPVDDSVSKGQGVRVMFEGGSRIVMRLSGTGTEGATLRLYLERYEPKTGILDLDPQDALAPLIKAAETLAKISKHAGKSQPDVIT
ncbi:MAG: alpha-D-glucose phosphate-specific phosphoglucomutase, partial [Deltaproteobacteria bacterium]